MTKDEIIEHQRIETLYALYQQASTQRDAVMAQQQQIVNNWKLLEEAHEVIFKAVANRTHWRRTGTTKRRGKKIVAKLETADAPYGLKKDGTPAKKRGRKAK